MPPIGSRSFLREVGELVDCQSALENLLRPLLQGFVNKDKESTLALPCFMKKGTHTTKLDYKISSYKLKVKCPAWGTGPVPIGPSRHVFPE